MVDTTSSPILSADNERSLKSLLRAMTLASGRFSLILAHCNYNTLRSQITQQLRHQDQIQVRAIALSESAQTLFTAIKTELGDETPQAVIVSGLETVEHLDTLLLATNQVRDEFSKSLKCPLVLWVTNEVVAQLVRLTPDFYSWAPGLISFQLSSSELSTFLRQQADLCFAEVLNPHNPLLIDDLFRCQLQSLPRRQEVEAALQDLQTQAGNLQPDLVASRQFILGQADYAVDEIESAIANFTASLSCWQQSHHLERQGATLLYLGLCYLRWAEVDSTRKANHLEAAREALQNCLSAFESDNRLDLKAKFISYQGEALKQINAWSELQALVQAAQTLYHTYPFSLEQARCEGFLAEIALRHLQDYSAASHHAQAALQYLESVSPRPEVSQAKYWVFLAAAQQQLDQPQEAMRSLHQAQSHLSSPDNPHLYIQILENLRRLYFGQKQYEQAFEFKREQLKIESQYGMRAFIGAGSLQPHQQSRSKVSNSGTIAEEIAVSGRQQDVNRLLERVSRDDCKLTILHGQLGVGKSSLIQAGLIPTLDQEPIKARDVVVVLLRNYNNWTDKLGKELRQQIQARKNLAATTTHSPSTILEQLRNNENLNFLTVLIFDQFEEFFFSCPRPQSRQEFFKFLSACLEIPFIKIILSLRKDYLHYLLEWERFDDLKPINDNILSKDHRYELGNFSPGNTREIIQGLTNQLHLSLEDKLVNQLVQDLTGETGEIRPIELQVVGAQLHEEKIRTLEQYRKLGDRPKETLVQNYLEEVIRDCGSENENAARLVLYLLTGENNTRPPKTRAELETDLKALEKDLLKEAQKLDLVLEIFRQSGLVFLLPETPADRYQLVHDYLVAFIRKQQPQIDDLVKELEAKRKQLEETEESLKIAQLEKEISEEQRKREITERKKADQKFLISCLSSAVILISAIAIYSFVDSKRNAEFSKDKLRQVAIGKIDSAEDILRLKEESQIIEELALIEALNAGFILTPPEEFTQIIELGESEETNETFRMTALSLQKTIKHVVKKRNRPLDEKSMQYINVDINRFRANDLHFLIKQLRRIGCRLLLSGSSLNSKVLEDLLKNRNIDGIKCLDLG